MMVDQAKFTPFNFINDISFDKKYLFDESTESVYNGFVINKGFAQHLDTILLANELNKRPLLSKLMQHDFLFYSVIAKKRYGKWAKQQKDEGELLDYLKKTYCINNKVADVYASMLSEETKAEIETKLKTMKQKG